MTSYRFAISRPPLLPDAELRENPVQDVFRADGTGDLAQGTSGTPQISRDKFPGHVIPQSRGTLAHGFLRTPE
jgi:hypothetical protein